MRQYTQCPRIDTSRWLQVKLALFLFLVPGFVSGVFEETGNQDGRRSASPSYLRIPAESSTWKNKFYGLFIGEKGTVHVNDGSRIDIDKSDRDLKSSSSGDEDDYWRWPDDYFIDDYVRRNRDDDFYRYIGDPAPPSLFPISGRAVVGFMLASLGVTLGSSGGK